MKISTIILTGSFLLIGALPRFCQAQTDSIPHPPQADTTSWDKKILPVNFSMPKAREFRTWEAGIFTGICFPTTDIAASDVNASYAHENIAFGAKVTKFFSHTLGAELDYMYATIQGQNRQLSTYGYTTTISYDLTMNIIAHIGNIRFLSRTPNIGIYAKFGVGLMHFNPVNDSVGITTNYNYLKNPNGIISLENYHNSTEYVIPFGVGFRYLASDKISLNLDYSLRDTRTDKLDGFAVTLSDYDNYTTVTLGVTYHFGKQREIIEWTNPLDVLYNRLNFVINQLQMDIDSLKKDTDGDGVSDYFDKDNNTPKGFMVYGNGTAVDFDGDGVPDAIDFCPTIPGPASNHGCPVTVVQKVEAKKPQEVEVTPITNEEKEIISEAFKNLQFETGKSVIRESSFLSLNELVNLLKKKPSYRLLIEGHTDNVGGAAANMKLSTDRSNSVKQYFVEKGIDASRLDAKAYGMTRPIADNKTPEGRQMNRRVDFTIIK